jgi:DNA-directed RNA polymerase
VTPAQARELQGLKELLEIEEDPVQSAVVETKGAGAYAALEGLLGQLDGEAAAAEAEAEPEVKPKLKRRSKKQREIDEAEAAAVRAVGEELGVLEEEEEDEDEDAEREEAARMKTEEERQLLHKFVDLTSLLPPLPKKGSFEVKLIKDSQYFFS